MKIHVERLADNGIVVLAGELGEGIIVNENSIVTSSIRCASGSDKGYLYNKKINKIIPIDNFTKVTLYPAHWFKSFDGDFPIIENFDTVIDETGEKFIVSIINDNKDERENFYLINDKLKVIQTNNKITLYLIEKYVK